MGRETPHWGDPLCRELDMQDAANAYAKEQLEYQPNYKRVTVTFRDMTRIVEVFYFVREAYIDGEFLVMMIDDVDMESGLPLKNQSHMQYVHTDIIAWFIVAYQPLEYRPRKVTPITTRLTNE